ncbi:flagellar basal body rod protein [Paenibacillus thiaminolyticus]|uniref:Flagellar basal body rod protein n=1 Tax=Paenibacillus thiaminolyticus TaxID=49283 RepID=A0A3A3GUC7_PANTH|nr:flagellar basal body rod protein [Paenibacillus thiaminolyticus]RJG21211.1 flagellar basal body rod protein [Paenibacillus thiaminolyticus]
MKRIQAYTRTEDEAETLRTMLIAAGATNIEVGELGGPLGSKQMLFAPFITGSANGSAYNGGISAVGPGGIVSMRDDGQEALMTTPATELTDNEGGRGIASSERMEEPDGLRYVVTAKTDDADYDDAVRLIRENGGYFDPGEEG